MTLWIVTTGSSDVQLKTGDNFDVLYNRIDSTKYEVLKDYNFKYPVEDENTGLYPVDSRILGWVYSHYLKDYGKDLDFPILESLMPMIREKYSKNNYNSTLKILVLLTDQSKIFDESDSNEIGLANCPYWQDTCTLEPIFEWYFQKELQIKPYFCLIQPINSQERKGIDHWNEMLTVVKEKLDESCKSLKLEPDEVVYVSHQAGTPAISSAVQFVSIGKFKTVKFLVSNLFYNPEAEEKIEERQYKAEVIDSSTYWRSLQVQKAKELMIKGFPGSALELIRGLVDQSVIDQLETWVNIFNIKATVDNKKDEFKPKNAIERVRRALDLIEIFFKQENYLQGITLLMAAQETFLKAAIIHLVSLIDGKTGNISFVDLLTWDETGLYFKSKDDLCNLPDFDLSKNPDLDLAATLHFPKPRRHPQKIEFTNFFMNYLYQPSENRHHDFTLNYICHPEKEKNSFSYKLMNFRLFLWLQRLAKETLDPETKEKLNLENWEWKLLEWSCEYSRTHDLDLRNQYVHNLRGGEKKDILRYLIDPNNQTNIAENQNVQNVYNLKVKKPFINALHSLRLLDDNLEVNLIEQDLKDLANRL